ncbi:SIS domain-containing protein [Candidatus Giovannonibacteria bacterium]|nr:SIS domain-containing protein [Candidatus Giovannonibacteria bacterium]
MENDYIDNYLNEVAEITKKVDKSAIHKTVDILRNARDNKGRLFIVGVGGSAANASHAVNDFRKIAHIESYTPTDNVAELTARVNDDGWDSVFVRWLERNNIGPKDVVMVFSVGGGNAEKKVSTNIVHALDHAKEMGARVVGIVSRDGGHTARVADACILVPVVNHENVTAHAESWQAVLWHSMVFHPKLKMIEGKWEGIHKTPQII